MENEQKQKEIFTHGIWIVKPGNQDAFIEEWGSFAAWSNAEFPSSGKAYLLHDRTDSLRFVSFGPWHDEESINRWRASDRFALFVERVKELCSDLHPYTLDVATTSK